jgi:hypothetical protein
VISYQLRVPFLHVEGIMKKLMVFPAVVLILLFVLGCAESSIEKLISDFDDAVNNDSESQIRDVLSEDSDWYIIGDFSTFLDNFDGDRDIAHSNFDMDIAGTRATVYSDVTYSGGAISASDSVMFWTKRDSGFLSFIFGDWKVLRYYDNYDFSDPLWRKIQSQQ